MKPGARCPPKVKDREKRLIKLQQLRDDTCSLADLVRYAHTDLNLFISRPTISRILQHYNMISYILPRKLRITPSQKRNHLQWCYEHFDWSVKELVFQMKETMKYLIERTECIFVDSAMIVLDLNDRKNGSIKVVVLFMSHTQSSIYRTCMVNN